MNASLSHIRRTPRSRADVWLDVVTALSLFAASASLMIICLRWLA